MPLFRRDTTKAKADPNGERKVKPSSLPFLNKSASSLLRSGHANSRKLSSSTMSTASSRPASVYASTFPSSSAGSFIAPAAVTDTTPKQVTTSNFNSANVRPRAESWIYGTNSRAVSDSLPGQLPLPSINTSPVPVSLSTPPAIILMERTESVGSDKNRAHIKSIGGDTETSSDTESEFDVFEDAEEGYDEVEDMPSVLPESTKEEERSGTMLGGGNITRIRTGKRREKLTLQDCSLTPEELKEDTNRVREALHLFLNSRMIEAENVCLEKSDHRLYFSVGFSLIQAMKSMMTFEPADLNAAINTQRDSIKIAQLLRKKDSSTFETFGRFMKGSASVNTIRNMTVVQRHAELLYAQNVLLNAILGIVYSGDFLAFLREALNMRNACAIFRQLAKYMEEEDSKAKGGKSDAIDEDFRSGVCLGSGLNALVLSLLPGKVLKVMEVFGLSGDRTYALETLMKPGGWVAGRNEPTMNEQNEGVQRQLCDMALLFYHLVISSFLPISGVDIELSDAILRYNMKRYPKGVFFLYFSGRLHATRTESALALTQLDRAIKAQREYVQLHHICQWDMAILYMATFDFKNAYTQLRTLSEESNWSKAVYSYAKAVALYEVGNTEQATSIMKTVPDLMQRIAGKSLPLEKFVARRSKNYLENQNRLICPGVELAYMLNCLNLSPRRDLFDHHYKCVSDAISELEAVEDEVVYGPKYWDHYCLALLLKGIILHIMVHPEPHVRPDPPQPQLSASEANEQAESAYLSILEHGPDISEDHHLVWFAHHHLGRLYQVTGRRKQAKTEYDIVMSGRIPEIAHRKQKGKVSMQNMVVLRTNAALQKLEEEGGQL